MPSQDNGSDDDKGVISEADRAEFKRRSAELGRRLESLRPEDAKRAARSGGQGRDDKSREQLGRALRLSTELIGGIVVGTAMGWGLDTYVMPAVFGVKTWPLMFIIFFLFGAAAGMLNVIRAGMKTNGDLRDPDRQDGSN